MLTFIRGFFKSKLGVGVTLAFLVLIGLAFASGDVASNGAFGGVAGGDRIAVVGKEKISTNDLSRAVTARVDSMRQQDPTLTTQAFIAQGGLEKVLDGMIDRYAIGGYAEKIGLRAGKNLVNSEIIKIPAFAGNDGNFDDKVYRAAISQRGLTDKLVRADISDGLLSQQLMAPATFGTSMPDKFVIHYASLLKERRKGNIGIILSAAYAPKDKPTDKQLSAYYDAHKKDYIRPERRVIRYATFDASQITDRIEPTDAAIAAQYDKDKAKYAASETRSFTQLIVPTKQAGEAIAKEVEAGGSLDAAARKAGLQTSKVGPVTSDALTGLSSKDVSDAVFAAQNGKLAAITRSALGWHIMQVDKVTQIPGRSLEQVRSEIADQLRDTNRRKALNDLAARVEEQLDDGTALKDVAAQLGVKLAESPPVTADGAIYGTGAHAQAELAQVIPTAFQMEDEGEPQLADVGRGQKYMIFEVSRITQSAAAPLAEIRPQVAAEWSKAEGAKKAKEVADKVIARMAKGETLQAAMNAEKAKGPPVDPINISREELARSQRQVPAPLALFFSMAEGSTKPLEAPGDNGWFLVNLVSIEPGKMAKDDPLFADAKSQLGQALGQEYGEELQNAVRADMEVERNAPALEAVRKQLTGES